MKCPSIRKVAIIADDAEFAARLSCVLNRPGYYLPILDGPRMGRPDSRGEAVRRNNAVARAAIKRVMLADLSTEQQRAMADILPSTSILKLTEDAFSKSPKSKPYQSTLMWGRSHIGVGLLRALKNKQMLEFKDGANVDTAELTNKKHLVVCEVGEPLSEVIAANYAYALDADFVCLPKVDKEISEAVTEDLYSLYDQQGQSASDSLVRLVKQIKQFCPGIEPSDARGITFFTSHIPYGFAFPEISSTHLKTYPDLGVAVLNGFAAENSKTTGVRCAVLVDPGEVEAAEVRTVAKSLARRKAFVRGYPSTTANVRDITNTVELFPYDFLMFATHCGDADGLRFTYEFEDALGLSRRLVIDTAIGVAHTDDPEMFNVMQYQRFHELDGVSWHDPNKSTKLKVGTAIQDFIEQKRNGLIEPVDRVEIDRVLGSAALKMADNNYIAMPRELAGGGAPVIFNNACASWHELSDRFIFAGARAYIGTLFPVTGVEAAQIAELFVEQDQETTLAEALWRSQKQTYDQTDTRRPYVIAGVYPQTLKVFVGDTPNYIRERLEASLQSWLSRKPRDPAESNAVVEIVRYYEAEIEHFKRILARQKTRPRQKLRPRKKKLFRP